MAIEVGVMGLIQESTTGAVGGQVHVLWCLSGLFLFVLCVGDTPSCLCAQSFLLDLLRGPSRVLGIKPGPAMCKISPLHTVLCLCSDPRLLAWGSAPVPRIFCGIPHCHDMRVGAPVSGVEVRKKQKPGSLGDGEMQAHPSGKLGCRAPHAVPSHCCSTSCCQMFSQNPLIYCQASSKGGEVR